MRVLRFIISLTLLAGLLYGLGAKHGQLPRLGSFFYPLLGFWQNAEGVHPDWSSTSVLTGLKESVEIIYDGRRVPHIFAQNDFDLYFAQGFVTARDRLWQMDLQTRAAAGRLSEVVGEKALPLDRLHRRIGLAYGAERSLEMMQANGISNEILEAYTAGINAYIASLGKAELPIEYKLLDYQPEAWTPLKTALLLKYMSLTLTANELDFGLSNAFRIIGAEDFAELYPNFPAGIDPIISDSSTYPEAPIVSERASIADFQALLPASSDIHAPIRGSNNWAVSAGKTANGKALLCNDPHLGLNLPSLWYEIHLHTPSSNTYGASLPGSPAIISGFNDSIAWGVTNAALDVRDWYQIEWVDDSRTVYVMDGETKTAQLRFEHIEVKGGSTFIDTVRYTEHGPVVYDRHFQTKEQPGDIGDLAVRWTAHDLSDELATFYQLNRAANHDDYLEALSTYVCPGQNFVFASASGDVAIRQQGRFPVRRPGQGRLVTSGTSSSELWSSFVPNEHLPQEHNPARGFVSSANQHPTDSTYPYYYSGKFEFYRNRRINQFLAADSNHSVETMKALHNDQFWLLASEAVPVLLRHMQGDTVQAALMNEVRNWDYQANAEDVAPILFHLWWDSLVDLTWDEMTGVKAEVRLPEDPLLVAMLDQRPGHRYFDIRSTVETEAAGEVVRLAWASATREYRRFTAAHGELRDPWATFKGSRAKHLSRSIDAFGTDILPIGGGSGIVSYSGRNHGASWKMIVELGQDGPEAWGVYPGGQSGNPGSPDYISFLETWTQGEYFALEFGEKDEITRRISCTLKPE